jgi:hypothetical protein
VTDPFLRADKDDPRFIAFGQKIGVIPKAVPSPERRTAQLGGKRMKPRMYANRRELLLQRDRATVLLVFIRSLPAVAGPFAVRKSPQKNIAAQDRLR